MENKAINQTKRINDDSINNKKHINYIPEDITLNYNTENNKVYTHSEIDGIYSNFAYDEDKNPHEYNISRNIEDTSPDSDIIINTNTNEYESSAQPFQNSHNNLFNHEEISFTEITNIVPNSPTTLGVYFATPINLTTSNQQSENVSDIYKNPNNETSNKKTKRRRTRDIKIPVFDEYLKKYCYNAVLDFPKYGIKKQCNICFNEYDINELFKDNRVSNNEIKYICLYCSIRVDLNDKDIKDWSNELEKTRRCVRCKSEKSDNKYKNGDIKYCMYCSLKKKRLYGKVLIGLEKQNKKRKRYENDDITDLEKINCCYV